MKAEYNFSKSVPNPFARYFTGREQVLIDRDIVEHFRSKAADAGISFVSLINRYLRSRVMADRRSKPKTASTTSRRKAASETSKKRTRQAA